MAGLPQRRLRPEVLPISEELQLLTNEWVPGDPVHGTHTSGYARRLFEFMAPPGGTDAHLDSPMYWSATPERGASRPPWSWLAPDRTKLSEARERIAA
jgi:hypothetical protein